MRKKKKSDAYGTERLNLLRLSLSELQEDSQWRCTSPSEHWKNIRALNWESSRCNKFRILISRSCQYSRNSDHYVST